MRPSGSIGSGAERNHPHRPVPAMADQARRRAVTTPPPARPPHRWPLDQPHHPRRRRRLPARQSRPHQAPAATGRPEDAHDPRCRARRPHQGARVASRATAVSSPTPHDMPADERRQGSAANELRPGGGVPLLCSTSPPAERTRASDPRRGPRPGRRAPPPDLRERDRRTTMSRRWHSGRGARSAALRSARCRRATTHRPPDSGSPPGRRCRPPRRRLECPPGRGVGPEEELPESVERITGVPMATTPRHGGRGEGGIEGHVDGGR